MSKADDMNAKVAQFVNDVTLAHQIVHGDETVTVLLGGKPTDSLRKLVWEVETAQNSLINDGKQQIQLIANQAQASAVSAAESARSAREDAEALTGSMEEVEAVFSALEPGMWSDTDNAIKAAHAAALDAVVTTNMLSQLNPIENIQE